MAVPRVKEVFKRCFDTPLPYLAITIIVSYRLASTQVCTTKRLLVPPTEV